MNFNILFDRIYKLKKYPSENQDMFEFMHELNSEPWTFRRKLRWEIEHGIGHRIDYVRRTPSRMKSTFLRARDGWSPADTWSFDWHLAKIISGGAKHIKNEGYAYPMLPGSWNEDGTPNESFDGLSKWNAILDEIIWTFETAEKIGHGDWEYFCPEDWTEELYDLCVKINKESQERHPIDIEYNERQHVMTFEECNRLKNGLHLFADHFFNLVY